MADSKSLDKPIGIINSTPMDNPDTRSVSRRKDDHLSLAMQTTVDFRSEHIGGFSAYRFDHDALPELDFDRIDLRTELFGRNLAAPLLIGAMTGGTANAKRINERLAIAAEKMQVGLALGSQRVLLEPESPPEARASYAVKALAPAIPLLFGNLGAVQLNYGVTVDQIRRLIEICGCDAFYFHLNPLQEAIQAEGNRDFRGLLAKIATVASEIPVPFLVKEVGAGISLTTARKLSGLPIQGVEVAGVGGTSWARIEALRAGTDRRGEAGREFARWGVPTAESIVHCREALPHLTVIGSGGIASGVDIAKALALGANAVAIARPFLMAAETSVDAVVHEIERLMLELRIAMFVSGFGSVSDLRSRGRQSLRAIADQNAMATEGRP